MMLQRLKQKLLAEVDKKSQEDGGIDKQDVVDAYNNLVAQANETDSTSNTDTLYSQATPASSEYDTLLAQLNNIKNFKGVQTNSLLG